jgi:hypothetical protein
MRYWLCGFCLLLSAAGIAVAQYDPVWETGVPDPQSIQVIGLANTDLDTQPELVYLDNTGELDQNQVFHFIDTRTGNVDWESDVFYHIYTDSLRPPRLEDIDHDGRAELLFVGQYDPEETFWFMYKFGGAGIKAPGYALARLPGLNQNFPNPMTHATRIDYTLPASTRVSLRIFDNAGRLVRTLVQGDDKPGRHLVRWDAKDDEGKPVAVGEYCYVLEAAGQRLVKKAVVVR